MRLYLTGILLFLPFQEKIIDSQFISDSNFQLFLKYLDEITIVVFLPLAIIEMAQYRKNNNFLYIITTGIAIIIFTIIGVISGIVKGNSLIVISLGTFDYVKYFLVIFIYAAFFKNFKDLKKTFYVLLIVVVFLGVISIAQEIWATGSRYVFGKNINDKSIYLFSKLTSIQKEFGIDDFEARWRYGIHRTTSLMDHSTHLGLYSLLFLTIYIFFRNKVNWSVAVFILSNIFVSVSRMIYMSTALIIIMFYLKHRKWLIVLLVPLLILTAYMSSKLADSDNPVEQVYSFRTYSRDKAMEIWKDHVLSGVGVGMYGGIISIKYNSYIYNEYDFNPYYLSSFYQFRSIDQFWPQVLAETGIIGLMGFVGILVSLILTLISLKKRTTHSEERYFLVGMIYFLIVLYIYLLGSGLNLTPVLFTYLAFVGMALGCINNQNKDNSMLVTASSI